MLRENVHKHVKASLGAFDVPQKPIVIMDPTPAHSGQFFTTFAEHFCCGGYTLIFPKGLVCNGSSAKTSYMVTTAVGRIIACEMNSIAMKKQDAVIQADPKTPEDDDAVKEASDEAANDTVNNAAPDESAEGEAALNDAVNDAAPDEHVEEEDCFSECISDIFANSQGKKNIERLKIEKCGYIDGEPFGVLSGHHIYYLIDGFFSMKDNILHTEN